MNRMNRANCCEVKPVQPDPGKQNSVPKLPNRNVDSTFSNQDKKKLRPPDKKNIDAHLNRIRLKEKELKSCNSECEFIREEMKTLQPNRCLLNEEKQKNNLDLKTLREEIRLKNNNLSRLESGLTYKNEHKINEAIKKLELQLTCNNFKMREKKKILAEIDSLKTSKKSLVNYLAQKREIDELREQQLKKRRENEQYHQQVSNLIFKEDEMRSRLNTLQTTIENLLLELNDLNEQKKILLSDYKKREKDHNVMKDAIRKKNRQNSKCKEDDERQQLSHRKNREEIHFQHTSEEEECIQHCNTLIRYLQHFPVADLGHTYQAQTPSEETAAAAASLGSSAEIQGDHDATYVLLKKNDGCEDFFFGAGRRQKKNKKGRKFSATKSLIHSPEVFAQFEKLEMSVPASMAEILPALNQLEGKKKYFECLKKQREKNLMPLNRVSESSIEQDDVCLSDSGYSADGSAACELSRQVSHTESIDDSSSNVSLLEIINLMQTESSAQNEHLLWSASSLSSASNKDDGLGIFREDENVLQKTSDGLGRLAQVSQDLPVVAGCPAENEVFLLDKREVSLKTESQPEAAAASGDQTSTKPKSETSDLRPVVLNDPCPKELQCCERLFSKNPAEMPSADGRDISISGDISKSNSTSSSSSSTSSSSSSNCSDDLSERVSRDFKALANVAKSKRVMNFPPMTDISCDLKGMEYEALTSPSGLRFTKRTALDRSLDGESSSSDNEEDRNTRVEEEVDQEDADRPNQGPVAGGDDDDDDNNNNNDEGEENDEVQEEEEEEDEKKAEEETTDNSDSEKYNEKSETVGDSEYGNDNTDDDDGKNLEDEERGLWKKI